MGESREQKMVRIYCSTVILFDDLEYPDQAVVLRLVADRIEYDNKLNAEKEKQKGSPLRSV
jgi:hypothetical protein